MGVFTLHSQGNYGLGNSGDTGAFTIGTEFNVSQSMSLTGIGFWSGSFASVLPSACGIYDTSTTGFVAGTSNSSPSWSGAAGSGWVKCDYSASGVTLVSGKKYVVAVYASSGTVWFGDLNGYWTTGAGGSGITNGPLSAPSSAAAVNGQAVFNSGTGIAFPASTVTGFDFGVDVEVTTPAGTAAATPAPLIVPQAAVMQAANW